MATTPRFLDLEQVAAELALSQTQVWRMVRARELPAIQVGGRGIWRVERAKLEEYIAERYRETERRYGGGDNTDVPNV